MDATRFDRLVRALTIAPTHRGLTRRLAGLGLAGTLGILFDPDPMRAKKKKKKCKGKRKCGKKCIPKSNCCTDADCSGDQICQGGVCILPFCGGKNHCDEFARCNSSGGACFCFVTAETDESFCGLLSDDVVDDCSACVGGEVCVNVQGPLCSSDPTIKCSPPCPEPL